MGAGDGLVRCGRGHAHGGVGVINALQDETFQRLADRDWRAVLAWGEGAFTSVEAEPGHARGFVGTVALEAGVGQDGADFAAEIDGGGGEERACGQ